MKFFAVASLFASLVSGIAVDLAKRDSPLDVKIEVIGNSEVKATVTNTGSTDLKILKTGSIFDEAEVEKSSIYAAGTKVEFDGLRITVGTTAVPEDAFQVIAAGETIETTFDVGVVHDLSTGGDFDIETAGTFSYAEADSSDVTGAVSYSSNKVTAHVDGAAAAKVRRDYKAMLAKRVIVQSDCTGTRRTSTVNAISGCRSLALAAQSAASSGAAARMTEYFKSSTTSTRSTVAAVFGRAASECGSTTSGSSRQYCTDVLGACRSNVLAYTQPSTGVMANCNLFYTGLPATSRTCHAQDQQTTTLHESTHLTTVRGTDDLAYGYSAVIRLSASQALNNADTYTLFAQSIYAGC